MMESISFLRNPLLASNLNCYCTVMLDFFVYLQIRAFNIYTLYIGKIVLGFELMAKGATVLEGVSGEIK